MPRDNQVESDGPSDCAADSGQLVAMIDAVIANTGSKPTQMSADSGYCSEDNIQAMEDRAIEAFIATGRQKHGAAAADGGKAQGAKVEQISHPGDASLDRAKVRIDAPDKNAFTIAERIVGCIVERIYGPWRWLLFYLAAGLTGEIAGYAWQPQGAGASVAGAGLLGALLTWLVGKA